MRYNDLIAAAVILQNTVDMMRILQTLVAEGHDIDISDIAYISPYMTAALKRFGDYFLNLKRAPEEWIRDPLFRKAASEARCSNGAALTVPRDETAMWEMADELIAELKDFIEVFNSAVALLQPLADLASES